MNFQFDSSRFGLLFFSRGRGRGHAVPDMAIAEELRKLRIDIDIRFVSYATGAATLAERGYPVIDLGLPEDNPALETLVLAAQLIGALQPGLVVAHEEFGAMPAAKIFRTPAVMITDWFKAPNAYSMQTLGYADEILFAGERGAFAEPPQAQGRIQYVGPILREFSYSPGERSRAREELGLDEATALILVLPGSWTEAKAPAQELIFEAYRRIERADKRMIWIAGADYERIQEKAAGTSGLVVKESDWELERLMVACDVAITKSTRKTASELAYFGVPSISLTHGLNPMDDQAMQRLSTTRLIRADEIDPPALAKLLDEALELKANRGTRGVGARPDGGRRKAAELLARLVRQIEEAAETRDASS